MVICTQARTHCFRTLFVGREAPHLGRNGNEVPVSRAKSTTWMALLRFSTRAHALKEDALPDS